MFNERIKVLRTSMNLNQVEFAKKLGVTKQSVSNWENNNIQPSIDMLFKIATTFSVFSDFLLGLDSRQTLDVTGLSSATVFHLQSLADELKKHL